MIQPPPTNVRRSSIADRQRMFLDGKRSRPCGLRRLNPNKYQRLLEKWLADGLTPAEEEQLPAGTLDKARSHLSAKIREGLDSIKGGAGIDGDEFFAKWRGRVRVR